MSYHGKLEVGAQLDEFRIDELVSSSGMATIYRAYDTINNRQVGIKIPHPNIEADPLLYDRFQREAEIGQKLDHPCVMKVYGGGKRSRVYMVMEWCEGVLLRKIINDVGKIPQPRALRLSVEFLEALDYIHVNGIFHRDLKPENIMVNDQDHIKLIDFGIAGNANARRLTYTSLSANLGTPDYISPEQVQGKRGDARSDIFSAGVIVYEMLTGKLPFHGANPLAVMNDRLLNHPVPPSVADPSISPELQEVLYRALERNPRNRYGHAHEFIHDLTHLDEVGVTDREEFQNWRNRRSPLKRKILYYVALAMIPVVILVVMILLAHSR